VGFVLRVTHGLQVNQLVKCGRDVQDIRRDYWFNYFQQKDLVFCEEREAEFENSFTESTDDFGAIMECLKRNRAPSSGTFSRAGRQQMSYTPIVGCDSGGSCYIYANPKFSSDVLMGALRFQ
jgi:hypothetical protein